MKEINLLPQKLLVKKRKGFFQKVIRLTSIFLIIIFGLLSVAVFSYAKTLEGKNNKIQEEISAEEEAIKKIGFVEDKIWLLQSRIESLDKILEERPYYSLIIKYLKRAVPPGITLTSLSTIAENKISVFGTVKNYNSLAKFLKAITTLEGAGKLFTQADLVSAILDSKSGEAQFVINVTWPEERLKSGGLE